MLIFHEGLPRSGKSYEALVSHIIPSLKKGRKVHARINGLNYEKIAQLCDLSLEEVQALLFHITEEQVPDVHEHVTNDSMVILDELQNFFPSGRGKLSDGITKFVTEHGHRGIDIVAMGQSIADCHNLWRRRTQRKIQFLKLDMVGSDKRYKWSAYQGSLDGKGDIRFTFVKSGTKKYDEKYFGSYASHQSETENTDNYEDDRLNVLKSNGVKYGVPVFALVLVYAVSHLVGFFGSEPEQETETQQVEAISQEQQVVSPAPQRPASQANTNHASNAVSQATTSSSVHRGDISNDADFVQLNNNAFNSKITYLELKRKFVWDMIVVWYDRTDKVQDRVTASDLKAMGYKLHYVGYGVEIIKDGYKSLYRFKPTFEPAYSIPDDTRESLVSS